MKSQNITRKIEQNEVIDHVKSIKKDGFCIIRNYVFSNKIDDVNFVLEECHKLFLNNKNNKGHFSPLGIQSVINSDRITNNVFHFNREILEIATTGDHLEIIKPFLNDPFYKLIPEEDSNFVLSQLNAREGRVALPFHVDTRMCTPGFSTWSMQGYLPTRPIGSRNGGLRIIAGSHKTGYFPDSNKVYNEAVALNLEAGDLVLFSSQCHHATSQCEDVTMAAWTLLFTYRCWWVKQQFDLESMVVPEVWNDLTPNQKLILGGCSRVSKDIYSSSSSRQGYEGLDHEE